MAKISLPAPLLATTLVMVGLSAPVHAARAIGEDAHGPMAHFMEHHGPMATAESHSRPARLGVAIAAIPQADLDASALEYGVRIEEVLEGSVAAEAGIRPGDVVTAIDGRPVYSPERMQHLVDRAGAASSIELTRNGDALNLQVEFARVAATGAAGRAVLGIRIQEMTEDLKEAFGAPGDQGVLISQVLNDTAASQAGLRAGDVVVTIGGSGVSSVRDVHSVLDGYAPGDTLDVSILRDRRPATLQVALGGVTGGHPPLMRGHGHHGHGMHGTVPQHGCHAGKRQKSS